MSKLRQDDVQEVIQRVRRRFGQESPGGESVSDSSAQPPAARTGPASSPLPPLPAPGAADSQGLFATVDEAVGAAWTAFCAYQNSGLNDRRGIIDRMRQRMRQEARQLAQWAWEETGLGRPEDKLTKNLLVVEKTPGPEDLESTVITGDHGLTMTEYAPYGVIGAITPTTNPTATIINNAIAVVAAGNAIVFNVHPNAKRVSAQTVLFLNRAVVEAGGPKNLITSVLQPTLESAQALMRHPQTRILLVTGGPGVVREALSTPKKAITAGPGNPPVVVDETADIELAGREIVRGASFDNNVICTDEKEIFAVECIADQLLRAMSQSGAVVLNAHQCRQMEKVIFKELGAPGKPGKINPRWIGKNAGQILAEIGIMADESVRLVVLDVPIEHSLVWTEQMMPVMPLARVRNVDQAIELAVKAEHGFGHTASIYSRNVDTITRLAKAINVSIFVANAPNLAGLGAGGEGHTSFSIASPTGEGLTRPRTFSRIRRLTIAGGLRIV